ncbi:hypothetical protein NN561_013453 [Cricetulus griseus]
MVLGPPSPRHQFWAKQLAVRYVTAMSQRTGMWRTLCSRLTSGTNVLGPGRGGPDITVRLHRSHVRPDQGRLPGAGASEGPAGPAPGTPRGTRNTDAEL